MQLFDAVDKHLKAPLSIKARNDLCDQILTYAFRGPVDAKGLTKYVKDHEIDFDTLGFRKDLATNGDILLNSKTYLYARVASKYQSETKPLKARECELTTEQARQLTGVLTHSRLLSGTLTSYARRGYKSLSPRQLKRLTVEVLCAEDYERSVGAFIRRKMRFLIQSFGLTSSELMSDIRAASLNAILRTYPKFEDYTHILRLAKATAKNTGRNIVTYNTTAGRQRLDINNQPKLIPLQITEVNGGVNFIEDPALAQSSFLIVGRTGTHTSNEELDTISSLNALLEDPRFCAKQKRFLKLMLGQHDEEFSAYLHEPNEDAVERDYERYRDKVCSFLNVPPDAAQRFLRKLAQFL